MNIRTFIGVIRSFTNWPLFLLDYMGLVRKKTLLYRLRDKTQFYARSRTLDSSTNTASRAKELRILRITNDELFDTPLVLDKIKKAL